MRGYVAEVGAGGKVAGGPDGELAHGRAVVFHCFMEVVCCDGVGRGDGRRKSERVLGSFDRGGGDDCAGRHGGCGGVLENVAVEKM